MVCPWHRDIGAMASHLAPVASRRIDKSFTSHAKREIRACLACLACHDVSSRAHISSNRLFSILSFLSSLAYTCRPFSPHNFVSNVPFLCRFLPRVDQRKASIRNNWENMNKILRVDRDTLCYCMLFCMKIFLHILYTILSDFIRLF